VESQIGRRFAAWMRGLKVVAPTVALALATGILTGGSCRYSSCDDDDDSWDDDDDCYDDDDDDDGWSSSTARPGEEAGAIDWLLRDYLLIPTNEPGAHPVSSVISIRGFSLAGKLRPGIYGDPELQQFTANVLHANVDLFALPPGQGRLRFDSIEHTSDFALVTYVQELVDGRDVATVVPGAALTFVFDLHGRLIEVDNSLRADAAPGAPAEAPPVAPVPAAR